MDNVKNKSIFKKLYLKDCDIDLSNYPFIISVGIFGSYHEECFVQDKSDIDIFVLTSKTLDIDTEFEIEDYLKKVLIKYFSYPNLHFTFVNNFVYPYSELVLISKDKIILDEEKYLDYTLGYSVFKRDRENLDIIREENLKYLRGDNQ